MSKMSQRHAELTQRAHELGFDGIEEAEYYGVDLEHPDKKQARHARKEKKLVEKYSHPLIMNAAGELTPIWMYQDEFIAKQRSARGCTIGAGLLLILTILFIAVDILGDGTVSVWAGYLILFGLHLLTTANIRRIEADNILDTVDTIMTLRLIRKQTEPKKQRKTRSDKGVKKGPRKK